MIDRKEPSPPRPHPRDSGRDKTPHPKPKPEGRQTRPHDGRDFDPLKKRNYKDYEGDAADPHQTGPGT